MPNEVDSEKRLVAGTEINLEILEAWDRIENECQINDDEKEKILDEGNRVKLKGYAASIQRYAKTWDLHIKDAGHAIKIKPIRRSLDERAYQLYNQFSGYLASVAMKMELGSFIDDDMIDNKKILIEPYALVKVILLRMALKILSSNGPKNDSALHHLHVMEKFIQYLSVTRALTRLQRWNLLDNGESASPFSIHFISTVPDWIGNMKKMAKEIQSINLVKTVVESIQVELKKCQYDTMRFLYMRLKKAWGGEEVRSSDFVEIWIPSVLQATEEMILGQASSDNKSLVRSTMQEDDSMQAILARARGESVCARLRIAEEEMQCIRALYRALYNISHIKRVVGYVDELTTLTGCVPFFYENIQVKQLDGYIADYIEDCHLACHIKGLEDTIIGDVIVSTSGSSIMHQRPSFSMLTEYEVQGSMSYQIRNVLRKMNTECQANGTRCIFKNESQLLQISDIQPVHVFPETRELTGQAREVDLVKQLPPMHTLLSCLNFNREHLEKLYVWISTPTNKNWLYVKNEAYMSLSGRRLPSALCDLLRSNNVGIDWETYNVSFRKLSMLANDMRISLRKSCEPAYITAQSDMDLVFDEQGYNPDSLKSFATRVDDYKISSQKSCEIFAEAMNCHDFIMAYFQYHYICKQRDLVYIPGLPTTIKALAEYHSLNLVMYNPASKVSGIEVDTCNSSGKGRVIKINVLTNTIVRDKPKKDKQCNLVNTGIPKSKKTAMHVTVSQPSVEKNDKTSTYKILFDLIKDRGVGTDAKKEVINYLLLGDRALLSIDEDYVKRKVSDARSKLVLLKNENQDFEELILEKARKYIFSGMKKFSDDNNDKNQKYFYELAVNKYNELVASYIYQEIFVDYYSVCKKIQPEICIGDRFFNLYLQYSKRGDSEFFAFSTDKNTYYTETARGEYEGFTARFLNEDASDALLELGIPNHNDLTEVLKKSISDNSCRKLIARDVCHQFKLDSEKNEHVNSEWKKLYKKYHRLNQASSKIRQVFDDCGFYYQGSSSDFAKYLNDEIMHLLSSSEKKEAIGFKACVDELREQEESMISYCATESFVESYISHLSKDVFPGRYALHVYAKIRDLSLFVYDKANSNGVQRITLDGDASISLVGSERYKKHIMFDNSRFYIIVPHQDDFSPKNVATIYLNNLNHTLLDSTSVCVDKNKPIDEYADILDKHLLFLDKKNIDIDKQREIKECNTDIEKEENWLSLVVQRKKILDAMKDKNEITLYYNRLKEVSDQAVLIDEPRDEDNQTLLACAVKMKDEELVQYLLDRDADQAVSYVPNFSVMFRYPQSMVVPFIPCYTYLIELNQCNEWVVNYYGEEGSNPAVILFENIDGLYDLLKSAENQDLVNHHQTLKECYRLITPYHEKVQLQSAMIVAAQTIAFDDSNLIFFKLLSGINTKLIDSHEANAMKLKGKYPKLHKFFTSFYREIVEHLGEYIDDRIDKRDRYIVHLGNTIYTLIYGQNYARAKELSLVLHEMVAAMQTSHYALLLDNLSVIIKHADKPDKSFLHLGLKKIIDKAMEWKMLNSKSLEEEYQKFKKFQCEDDKELIDGFEIDVNFYRNKSRSLMFGGHAGKLASGKSAFLSSHASSGSSTTKQKSTTDTCTTGGF